MNDDSTTALGQARGFLEGTEELALCIADKYESRVWIERSLRRFGYRTLSKADRGIVRRRLEVVSAYPCQQVLEVHKFSDVFGRTRKPSLRQKYCGVDWLCSENFRNYK